MTTTALFPGTFDPITLGHIDLALRAAAIFNHLIVAVSAASGAGKKPMFTANERERMVKLTFAQHPNISVIQFDGLLADFARTHNAKAMIRGIRTLSDYEYESQLAGMNRMLNPQLDTLYLSCDPRYSSISSSLIKEVATHGGDVTNFLTAEVLQAVKAKIANV